MTLNSSYRFQAAVELSLSLKIMDHNDQRQYRDYCVTVIVERTGLDEFDVVIDFRVLEAALNSALEPMQRHSLQELGMDGLPNVAKKVAETLSPFIVPPVKLATVSIRDEAGRQITLKS